MDIARFEGSPVGHLVPISGFDPRFNEEYSHFAYVADPLPNEVALSGDTWSVVTDAMLSLGRLDDATSRFPNPHLLVRPGGSRPGTWCMGDAASASVWLFLAGCF